MERSNDIYTYNTYVAHVEPHMFNIAGVSAVFWCHNELKKGDRVRLVIERIDDEKRERKTE